MSTNSTLVIPNLYIGDHDTAVGISGYSVNVAVYGPEDGMYVNNSKVSTSNDISGVYNYINAVSGMLINEIDERTRLIRKARASEICLGNYTNDLCFSGKKINFIPYDGTDRIHVHGLKVAYLNDIQTIYPIGSVYTTTNASLPASLPGNWSLLGTMFSLGSYALKAWRRDS